MVACSSTDALTMNCDFATLAHMARRQQQIRDDLCSVI